MKIGFFGIVGERIGREIEHAPAAHAVTISDLRRSLALAFPGEAALLVSPRLKAVIGDVVVSDNASIAGIEHVEFFPPVSGG